MFINEFAPDHIINEGPYDPGIFKAVFLAGGPGSGKSYVAGQLLTNTGLRSVNSDEVYEYLAKKQNFDLSDPDRVASDQGQEIRNRAKEISRNRERHYLDGRIGLIIDGTGKDVSKYENMAREKHLVLFLDRHVEVVNEVDALLIAGRNTLGECPDGGGAPS